MFKQIIEKIIVLALQKAYNRVDIDNDGYITFEEVRTEIYEPAKKYVCNLINRVNKKRNK